MNDSKSWAQGFKCYEQLKVVDDMSYTRSWAQRCGCYEMTKVVDDTNYSGSRDISNLDAINNSELWMLWTIIGYEPIMIWITQGYAWHELL